MFYDSCGPNGRVAYSNEVIIETKPALFAGDIYPGTQTIIAGSVPRLLQSTTPPHGGTSSFTIWWEKADVAVGPWTKVAGANSVSYQPPVTGKTTYYRRVVKDNNCLAEKYTFVVEVFTPVFEPLMGGGIAGSNCVFPGMIPTMLTTGTTTVSGGYGAYNYQWEYRTGTANFTAFAGAVSEQYQPGVITQTTQYRRRVTDALGLSQYSDTFTIALNATPLNPGKIATSNASICAGSTAGIINSVEDASGSNGNGYYQWQKRLENGTYTDIAGANQSTYTPDALMQSAYFRRAFVDECSGTARIGYSNEVFIKATPSALLLAGLIDGPFITCAGVAPATIKSVLDACGSCNLKYQWQVNNGSGWVDVEGATSSTYKPGVITTTTRYRRKVTDGTGANKNSNEVEIMVYPALFAGTIGEESQTVCLNAIPSIISLLTDCHYTDGSVVYQWQVADAANGSWTDIAGANAPAYQPTAATNIKYYRLMVTSASCGAVVYTNTATVLIKPGCLSTISATAVGFSNCLPVTPVALSYPELPCSAGYDYEWQYQMDNTTSWTGTGSGVNNFLVNSFYQDINMVIKWRLKMTSKECNSISYSNVLPVTQFTCRSNTSPIIYPNPSTAGQVIIVQSSDKPHKISLMTIDGKRLPTTILSNVRGFIRILLPSTLPSGTYVLEIRNPDGFWAEKLLIKNI